MIEDAIDPKNCLTGTFVSTKPLDDCDLAYGFTSIDNLPFFITQVKKDADGKYIMENSIAFTDVELQKFVRFMRKVLHE